MDTQKYKTALQNLEEPLIVGFRFETDFNGDMAVSVLIKVCEDDPARSYNLVEKVNQAITDMPVYCTYQF